MACPKKGFVLSLSKDGRQTPLSPPWFDKLTTNHVLEAREAVVTNKGRPGLWPPPSVSFVPDQAVSWSPMGRV